jgi:hypothetical protein
MEDSTILAIYMEIHNIVLSRKISSSNSSLTEQHLATLFATFVSP